jgi:alanyl-tRNA synthetase
MIAKDVLRRRFSREWDKYYKIGFLIRHGFERKICKKCGRGFWTLQDREICPDQPCSYYEFLGNPPTKRRFDYIDAWKAIEKFFVKNGHVALRRYPVVCRWYPLYFTVAGIIDFYRLEGGNVVFDFPENPTIVPQFCLRFNDIQNVGVTGKHYTCFVMVQQTSAHDGKKGYWKERCIELDFKLLHDVFGIPEEEIVFLEDLWVGPGAFGSSMEYFVRGLEIGNAVFTEFLILPGDKTKRMDMPVVDMGAGLERFAWITRGTPTSYDVSFGPVVRWLKKQTGITYDRKFFLRYAKQAGALNLDEVTSISDARDAIAKKLGVTPNVLKEKIAPIEAIYAIADHTLALTFAICDGILPSNTGGGYNLRVILRRALASMDKFGWKLDLAKICELHAKHLRQLAPELQEHMHEIEEILEIETRRYLATRKKAHQVVAKLIERKHIPSESELVRLYESEGIAPELIRDAFAKEKISFEIPHDFYVKLTARYMSEKEKEEEIIDISGLPATQLVFYANEKQRTFSAKVLRIVDSKYVVLDRTAFYGRAGGQEPDLGKLGGCAVTDVTKQGNVIVHTVMNPSFKEGDRVNGEIDLDRRLQLSQHHTATHLINAAAREVLGNHVWQHSAYKDVDHARLDVTHYKKLTDLEVKKIESLANSWIKKDMPVKKTFIPRMDAEKKYGFRLYQGGAVPARELRVVQIPVDVEACGGTHVDRTSEISSIIVTKSKRVQDGVVRIEFVAGKAADKVLRRWVETVDEISKFLGVTQDEIPAKILSIMNEIKSMQKKLLKAEREAVRDIVQKMRFKTIHGFRVLVKKIEGDREKLQLASATLSAEDTIIFLFGIHDNRIYIFASAGKKAMRKLDIGKLVRDMALELGGKGGGTPALGQGYGTEIKKLDMVVKKTETEIGRILR